MGGAITHARPLRIKRTPIDGFEAYRVNGTPADCVTLGTDAWGGVDIVLSGINLGYNLGNSIWHSGTLAAAKQAALLGTRGVALSTPTGGDEPDFSRLDPFVEEVLEVLIPATWLSLVNVNFPPQPTGLCWARQSVRHYDGRVVPDEDPLGRNIYWISVRPVDEIEEETDRWAVRNGLVAMTPLRVDLTDDEALSRAKERVQIPSSARTSTSSSSSSTDR